MNFVKHTWVNGEVITAPLLNRIEDALVALSQDQSIATDADCDALFDDFLEDN